MERARGTDSFYPHHSSHSSVPGETFWAHKFCHRESEAGEWARGFPSSARGWQRGPSSLTPPRPLSCELQAPGGRKGLGEGPGRLSEGSKGHRSYYPISHQEATHEPLGMSCNPPEWHTGTPTLPAPCGQLPVRAPDGGPGKLWQKASEHAQKASRVCAPWRNHNPSSGSPGGKRKGAAGIGPDVLQDQEEAFNLKYCPRKGQEVWSRLTPRRSEKASEFPARWRKVFLSRSQSRKPGGGDCSFAFEVSSARLQDFELKIVYTVKRNNEQNEKSVCRMAENVCESYIRWRVDIQYLQGTHTS